MVRVSGRVYIGTLSSLLWMSEPGPSQNLDGGIKSMWFGRKLGRMTSSTWHKMFVNIHMYSLVVCYLLNPFSFLSYCSSQCTSHFGSQRKKSNLTLNSIPTTPHLWGQTNTQHIHTPSHSALTPLLQPPCLTKRSARTILSLQLYENKDGQTQTTQRTKGES